MLVLDQLPWLKSAVAQQVTMAYLARLAMSDTSDKRLDHGWDVVFAKKNLAVQELMVIQPVEFHAK